MIYLLDPQVLEQTVNASPLPADETARALLSAPGVAVASSSIPALRALLKKNGICGTPIKKVLQGTKIVKTPSYIDFDDELAETDLEKYLIALAAQSVGGYFITRDEHALRICPWAVSPDRPLPSGDKLQFCDLKRQHTLLYAEVEKKIDDVLRHGQFIQGPEVKELEARCAEFTGSRHAIAVATGTDALLLALMAYDVAPGDYVITTPFTFISTAEVISLLGATPLFVDVERDTYNICPQALRALVETPTDPATGKAISADKLRGAIAVDIFGQPADYDALRGVLQEKGLFLIEDGAQSFGAQYKGKRACALGDISTTSFFPAKPLGCYGDGGMMFTDDDALAAKIRSLLNHGQTKRYHHSLIGINGRLDTLQAAILLAKFDRFVTTEIEQRNTVAGWYAEDLEALAAEGKVTLPTVADHGDGTTTSVWAQFSILVKERDRLRERLEEAGIPTAVHYPVPLHLQEAFAPLNYPRGAFPVAERISANIISLPMDPWKTREEIRQITEIIGRLL